MVQCLFQSQDMAVTSPKDVASPNTVSVRYSPQHCDLHNLLPASSRRVASLSFTYYMPQTNLAHIISCRPFMAASLPTSMLDLIRTMLSPEAANAIPDQDTRHQPTGSRLLDLPAEIRIMIWECMTLCPETPDCLEWTGAYFTSRQVQLEMRDALKPEEYAENPDLVACHNPSFVRNELLYDPCRQLHVVVVKLPVPERHFCCEGTLMRLYVTTQLRTPEMVH